VHARRDFELSSSCCARVQGVNSSVLSVARFLIADALSFSQYESTKKAYFTHRETASLADASESLQTPLSKMTRIEHALVSLGSTLRAISDRVLVFFSHQTDGLLV
jgi:hypothetical protein